MRFMAWSVGIAIGVVVVAGQTAEVTDRDFPGGFGSMQAAINACNPATDKVIVTIANTYPETFDVNQGVRVVNTSGGTVTFSKAGSITYLVTLSAAGATLEGFNLEAQSGTGSLIHLTAGEVKNCTLDNMGFAFGGLGLVVMSAGTSFHDNTMTLTGAQTNAIVISTSTSGRPG